MRRPDHRPGSSHPEQAAEGSPPSEQPATDEPLAGCWSSCGRAEALRGHASVDPVALRAEMTNPV